MIPFDVSSIIRFTVNCCPHGVIGAHIESNDGPHAAYRSPWVGTEQAALVIQADVFVKSKENICPKVGHQ